MSTHATDLVSFQATLLHFFGEVEAIFGDLGGGASWCDVRFSRPRFRDGLPHGSQSVNFTEPVFVVVIMAWPRLADPPFRGRPSSDSSPKMGKETPAAWWLAILIAGPNARFPDHGAGRHDDFGDAPGSQILPTQALAGVCLRHVGSIVRQHFGGRRAHQFRGSARPHGGPRLGPDHAGNVRALWGEGAGRGLSFPLWSTSPGSGRSWRPWRNAPTDHGRGRSRAT